MRTFVQQVQRFLAELKRRNVYKVATAYATAAFVTLEAAEIIFPATVLKGSFNILVVLVVGGFPVALILAWVFDVTSEGVERTPSSDGEDGPASASAGKVYRWLGGTVLVVLFVATWLVLGGLPARNDSAPPTEDEAAAPDRSVTDRSIAVLPFQNLGGEESEQFTRGIHDGLLTRLSNVSDLEVISRTSVMRFQNASQGVPEIATDLGAKWIVEGAVQKAGQQVLVNAQLIDGETDTHRWAQDYQRKLTTDNLFDIQAELTRKISRSLRAELTTSEKRRVADHPTDDLDAFQLYAQGRGLLKQRTETAMRQSIDYFQQAIEQDSTYAPAWAGLADATALLQNYGYERPELVLPPDSSARRALSLNPELAEAHTALSMTYQRQGDGPAALRAVNRAVELNPSYSLAHNQRAWLLLMLGKPEPAHSSAKKSVRLDPLSAEARSQLFNTNLALGNPEAALKAAQKTREVNEDEDYKTGRLYEALASYHLDRYEDARTLLTSLSVPWAGAGAEVTLLLTHVKQGRDADALSSEVKQYGDRFAIGLAHAALGRTEKAFAAFEGIEEWGYWPTLALRYYFPDVLGPLRDQPRFESLMRRVNQQHGLNPDGSLPSSVLLSTTSPGFSRTGGKGYSSIAPLATASIPSSSRRMVVQSSSGSAPRSR